MYTPPLHPNFYQPHVKVAVLITSIRHRLPVLNKLLEALASQTQKPSEVLLRLDGYAAEELVARPLYDANAIQVPAGLNVSMWRDEMPGAGRRWFHPGLRSFSDDTVVHTIDDDLIPHPDYLARTTQLVLAENAAITWHGWASEKGFSVEEGGAFFSAPTRTQRVVAMGAGVSAFRWRWVRTIADDAIAGTFLEDGPRCDDDAWLSCWLWRNGVTMLRPAGPAPIDETEESRGPRATFMVHSGYRYGQRLGLALAYDWPGLDRQFPGPVHDLARAFPNSRLESGLASVIGAMLHDTDSGYPRERTRMLSAIVRACAEAGPKHAPAYATRLMPELLQLQPDDRVLSIGVGRWTIWSRMVAALRDAMYTIQTPHPTILDGLPPLHGLGPVRALELAGIESEDYSTPTKPPNGGRWNLIIVAPGLDPEAVRWVHDHAHRVVVLSVGGEQC